MKAIIFNQIKESLQEGGFTIGSYDDNRPWGGFFVIDEDQAQQFANHYFEGLDVSSLKISGKLSPKILLVAPEQRLSWQYHHRRAEIWRLIDGAAGVIRSQDDTPGQLEVLKKGDFITLQQGERHRLVGLEDWGVIAEIWQHTDTENPSDEDDIVRVQDDFGRC
ncbi:phosphoheptose isomerase [Flavobacterium sp. K5-23]|uniref:phosphoheptose isomerase n=1 Tax=Flavobacterium sp. K5-23 TaxID=2746225 RepID=UPI00200E98BE|nr:phosphoheptose isomerase [Flavobacterium sp. K5-23]UQD56129.1 phosphoheptose isomerase [Flavobacterium sp. K5-23]